MGESVEPSDPLQLITSLSNGYWVPRCLHVIAELGVADHIADEVVPVTDLARALSVHPEALARVLRALASRGVFEHVAGGFRHTPASRLLRSDDPRSQRGLARMMGMPVHWAAYGALEYSVRTGHSALSHLTSGGTFEYFASHPQESRLFDEAMTAKSHEQIAAVLAAYDFKGFGRIADIGGGRGHLLRAVLAAAPQAHGVLFDLPHVVGALEAGTADRLTLQAGSFFRDPLPVCDAYLLMSVLHDWGDTQAVQILEAVRRAAPVRATLLVLELVVPEEPGPHPAKLLDIEMLVMTQGGRERSRAEFERLFAQSGLRLSRIVPTSGATMILEGLAI